MNMQIRPCDDAAQLRDYIHTYWRAGHILAENEAMFGFTYCTPWVDRSIFPAGISVLGLYDGSRMTGFLGAIVAPYPRKQSYWLALWHVLPETKGSGLGGKLLARMQNIAESEGGWIGTFGAGPEALPVYLKRGYCVRAARRWIYLGGASGPAGLEMPGSRSEPELHSAEATPDETWIDYRFRNHPFFKYDIRAGGIFRTEENAWGVVTHVCRLGAEWEEDVRAVHQQTSARAQKQNQQYLMDAWAFDCPGPGWSLAPEDIPSVFHPPEARGNVIYAVGRPFLFTQVHKGDCDQDRPNLEAPQSALSEPGKVSDK